MFKPADMEKESGRTFEPGTFWRREIATYRIDATIGYGVVAPTVHRALRGQGGSLQKFVPDQGLHPDSYSALDQQKVGVLDYVLAQTDRGDTDPERRGWRTSSSRRPVLIDNGLSLPRHNGDALTTAWLSPAFDVRLDDSVTGPLQSLQFGRIREVLRDVGIENDASEALIDRLRETRGGRITGRSWRGRIVPSPTSYSATTG